MKTTSRSAVGAFIAGSALAANGCAPPPRTVLVPVEPAVTGLGEKATGEVEFVVLNPGRKVVGRGPQLALNHSGTMAQSGEGSLGDRLFREDENGFVQACRYVAKGRVCELITLADGTHLGGGVHWIVPKGSKATPRAGGWLAHGTFVVPSLRLDRDARAVNSLGSLMAGRAYHCRFENVGAKCLLVPVLAKGGVYALLGTFSLADGPMTREVLWVGLMDEVNHPGAASELGIRELHRCETTETSSEVSCKAVTLR